MNYFRAPDQINYSDINSRECLFLAGSISNAKNWQRSITEISHKGLKLNDLFHMFNPRREDDNTLDPSVELEQIYTASSVGIQACGDGSSEKTISLSPSAKQEFNKKSRVYILKV